MHNLSEILMYSGIALLLVPMFDLLWASILLVLIAFYDMYAVWKSEHMVEMAKFQTKSKLFAGLLIPYKMPKSAKQEKQEKLEKAARTTAGSSNKNLQAPMPSSSGASGQKTAVLGGGDIAFPLIFSGVALEWLLRMGYTKSAAFLHSNIITLFATLALIGLFIFAKKDRFYPAMPFLAAGCFIGLAVMWLLL
jgi:presenilin-like A22 family membrane protease